MRCEPALAALLLIAAAPATAAAPRAGTVWIATCTGDRRPLDLPQRDHEGSDLPACHGAPAASREGKRRVG